MNIRLNLIYIIIIHEIRILKYTVLLQVYQKVLEDTKAL
jgi:hypothetical protein